MQIYQLSIVITRYGETDELVKLCLSSLIKQQNCNITVLFLDQKESENIKSFCKQNTSNDHAFHYEKIPAKSLSYARNHGISISKTDLIAFCDSDCILAANWAEEIVATFKEYDASIVGTKIIPVWQSKPSWYHKSRLIREFYSLIDLSEERMEIGKVVGASFALDRSKLREKVYFDESLGRQKGILLGGEETDLCKRVKDKGGKIVYTPHTYAEHVVSSSRINLKWLIKRAYFGGVSRALRKGKIETFNKKREFIDYMATILILPAYVLGYWRGKSTNV